ncbi:MAG: HAD family hydrolase, partial [Acidimicrobiales bacterium]
MIIFDCDGVLVDSEVIVIEVEAELLTAAGFPVTADEIADNYVGLSYPDMMGSLERRFGRSVPPGLSEQIQRAALDAFPGTLAPVAGMTALLEGIEGLRCVASSSGPSRIRLSLDLTGLDRFFDPDHLFSATMVARGKPAPDLFLLAAERMDVSPSRCLVVEDSPHGVTAARAAGMDVVGFVGGRHARPSLT